VGKVEGKSVASRFSIKNEGFLIDGDRFMMAGINGGKLGRCAGEK
jgi:hypothetical protein